jgi:transcriptional regulator with XRE-family HTH domain
MADQRSFRSLEGLTGVPEETIRDLKRGRIKSPRLDTLRQLAKVYGQRRKAA